MPLLPPSHPLTLRVQADLRAWLKGVVVGLNLCPFAAPVLRQSRLRCAVSGATEEEGLFQDLQREIHHLLETDPQILSTTLIAAPHCLESFEDFLDFLEVSDAFLEGEGLRGVLQIASFHPEYQFEGEGVGRSVYTNRAPYPVLHLLRESEVGEAIESHPDPGGIPARNIERLDGLSEVAFAEILRLSAPGEG